MFCLRCFDPWLILGVECDFRVSMKLLCFVKAAVDDEDNVKARARFVKPEPKQCHV